jgi:signal transduction histidine kinase
MGQPPEAPPQILVVDDNEQNRALARATLEDENYRVVLAASGAEALTLAQLDPPDCVLLDVRMPGMTGFDVCRKLRELPQGADVPVVFLTALRDVDTFDEALRAGGDDFLTKPVRPTELVLRIQAALRLRRLNASNREYYELARRQRDDLMRLTLQKERLMAFVVHDLKNPVSSIDLWAQVLLRDKELPARLREPAATIRDEVRALMRLIMNLLDISKGEEGQLTPKLAPTELRELVGGVAELMTVRARARNLTLEVRVGAERVNADAELTGRVLENLVDNALKHAPEGSSIMLTARQVGNEVELRVADRGEGVPADLRESIFDRYVQVESGKGVSRAGRGLGLSFCRLAVEAQGGSIHYEDAAPGAVFCVRLAAA